MAPYQDLSSLVMDLTKDVDYAFEIMDRGEAISIISIHGGTIEPLCSLLAAAISAETHNLYDLRGLLPMPEGAELRISPGRFQEMRLRGLLQHSQVAVAIDGVAGDVPFVGLGGRNRQLRAMLFDHLSKAGFETRPSVGVVAGHNPKLYYNWPTHGGVGIQVSRGLREQMAVGDLDAVWDEEIHGVATMTETYDRFVGAVRAALDAYAAELLVDLDTTMDRFERDTAAFPPTIRNTRLDPHHHH